MGISSLNINRRFKGYFLLSLLLIIVLNIFVWLYMQQVENRFEDELQERLFTVNQLLNRLIFEYSSDVSLDRLIYSDPNSIEYLYYQQLLNDIRTQSHLQSIIIVSPDGKTLVSAPAILSERSILSLTNNVFFDKALKGNQIVSDLDEISGEHFVSAYSPLQDLDGFLTGILIIEAKANYFDVLTSLKGQLLLFSFINFVLIIVIASFLYWMINRTIRAEREIQDREHLVQLGTMAASVAHELRNPLNIIDATNDTIRKKYAKEKDEIFSFIPQEIKRLSVLIDDFLKFARSPKLQIISINLIAVLKKVISSFNSTEQSRIVFELPEKTQKIISDPGLIQQALTNIIQNALQASDKIQKIHVKLSFGNKKVAISVIDQGPGIDETMKDKIFEPFYTTKEKGTGLGLAITKRLINHLQGSISLISEQNQGTTVTLTLPSLINEK